MKNPFANRTAAPGGPARDIAPVTPNDSTDLPNVAVALYAEGAGTIAFVTEAGELRTVGVTDYALLPVGVRRVHATGTTATGLHALMVS